MHKFQLRTLKVMMTSRQCVNKQHISLRCHCQVTVTEFDNIFIDLHADPALDIFLAISYQLAFSVDL